MIFHTYTEQKEKICGITFVSCGHIFAKNGIPLAFQEIGLIKPSGNQKKEHRSITKN